MLRLFLTVCFIFLSEGVAHPNNTDSLEVVITNTKNKRKKVDLLNELVPDYGRGNPEKALGKALEALDISKSIRYRKGIGSAYLNLGSTYQILGENDSALLHYNNALQIFRDLTYDSKTGETLYKKASLLFTISNYKAALQNGNEALDIFNILEDELMLASVHGLLCNIKSYLGFKSSAIENCRKSLVIFESLNLTDGKSRLLNSLGNIYLDLKQYDRCEQYFNRALYMAKFEQDSSIIATTLNNLGHVHLAMGDYEEAIQFFDKAFSINLKKDNLKGLSNSLYYLGISSAESGENDKALSYLNQSLKYSNQAADLELQAKVVSEIGNHYAEIGAYQLAIDYLNESLILAQKVDADPILQSCYHNLAKYYDMLGDSENSLVFFKLYMLHKEEIFDHQTAQKIAEAEALYNLEKKDKQIQLLRSENRIKDLEASERNLMNVWLITGLLFVFTTMIVVYRQYKMQNKANKILQKQKEAIQKQKEEILSQRNDIEKINHIITEKNLQITDSIEYAKRIQLSILPDKNLLKENFEDSFTLYLPRDIVSGDFFWLKRKNDLICIAVVDCTGHGVPGAFMTLLANSLLNQISLDEEYCASPNKVLHILDEKVKQNLNQYDTSLSSFDGMDMALCMLNTKTKKIIYAGAKMPVYISQNKVFHQIKGDRFSVGGIDVTDKNFDMKTIQLHEGDIIYFATDGFQDQFGGNEVKKYMKLHFKNLLKEVSKYPLSKQEAKLKEVFNKWKGYNIQTDDVLVLGIKV